MAAPDEHRAHWPTTRRLLLRLGEARAGAPQCQTIEARPQQARRGAAVGRSHLGESSSACSVRPADARSVEVMEGGGEGRRRLLAGSGAAAPAVD
jgi:hypothetical protein